MHQSSSQEGLKEGGRQEGPADEMLCCHHANREKSYGCCSIKSDLTLQVKTKKSRIYQFSVVFRSFLRLVAFGHINKKLHF